MPVFNIIIPTVAPPGSAGDPSGAFIKIDGRETLLKTVELFLNRENVKQIQVVFTNEFLEEGKRKYGGHFSFSGIKVVGGGPKWIDQLIAASSKLDPESTHVLIHDAARPALSYVDLEAVMEAAEKHAAVALATPMRSQLVEMDEGGSPVAFQPASQFAQMVTPLAFSKERFLKMTASKAEPHASEYKLVIGHPANVRAGADHGAGFMKSMIALLPKPKLKAPSSPFEEAEW